MTTNPTVGHGDAEARAANLAILGETLSASCVELMADYGIEARPLSGQAAAGPPVAVLVAGVDFQGRAMRGSVALWAARDVLLQTARAAPGLDASANDLPDWTCELANQLLGRMKNKLRVYDVSLSMNVPRIIASPEVNELDAGLRYRFSCEFGALSATLDVLTASGFVLERREPDPTLVQEGDFTLL